MARPLHGWSARLVEALVDTKTDVNGEVKMYYALGEHGLCGNPDWASCLYRMVCIKCPFFMPRDQEEAVERTQSLQAPTILRRRAKGSKSRSIPLTILNNIQIAEERQNTGTL